MITHHDRNVNIINYILHYFVFHGKTVYNCSFCNTSYGKFRGTGPLKLRSRFELLGRLLKMNNDKFTIYIHISFNRYSIFHVFLIGLWLEVGSTK